MGKTLEVARTGVTSIFLHPLRALVTVACVFAVLCPYLAGLGISRGVQAEAEISLREGADLYVSAILQGQKAPVPLQAKSEIEKIEGVTKVVPRIVGRIVLGRNRESAVLLGLPPESFPAAIECVEGRLPQPSKLNEFVVGTELARRLRLEVGARIPPDFYHNPKGQKISEVVGLFRSDVTLWQANLILTTFDKAADILGQPDLASDFLVYCRPGYEPHVSAKIARKEWRLGTAALQPRVTTRADLEAILPAGLLHREGVFNLHFVLIFIVGILVVLVTSGLGQHERRREIGILKATGWQTDEILLRGLVESFLLSLAGAALSILTAFVWLKCFNGYWIASVFLAGVDAAPGFQVPFRLAPVPALLAWVLSLALVMTGTLYSSWRAATVAPMTAMK